MGIQTCRTRLQRLSAANFTPRWTGGGIVGHVLRFEGGNTQTSAPRDPAKGRRQDRLADIRASALQHQCAGGHAAPSI